MDNIAVILLLCVCIPVIPAISLLSDKRSKLFLSFMLTGMALCLIASWVNSFLLDYFDGNIRYVTNNITPITEEILKVSAVLYFALFIDDKRDMVLSISLAVGLGFALLENMGVLVQNIETVSIPWAITHSLGAAQMHAVCTAMVGMGISYIRKRRKLFYCGTLSLLIAAIIFHGIFNSLVQSQHSSLAFVWVLLLLLPQIVFVVKKAQRENGKNDNI